MDGVTSPTRPSLLHAVTGPQRRWRQLGAGAKLAVYTRVSMQVGIISAGLAVLVLVLWGPGHPDIRVAGWQYPLFFLADAVMIVLAVAVTESRPEFTTAAKEPNNRLLRVAAGVSGLIWVLGIVLCTVGHGGTAMTGFYLLMLFFATAPLGILPWIPFRWPVAVVLTLVASVLAWEDLRWAPLFIGLGLMGTTVLSAWTVNLAKQLDRARVTESALQVSEERLRFSQELHDTLGQRLAAMSVKAELARALAKRGDERADAELAELQDLARTSVTEMHEVVDGYRAVNLSTEVEGARQLLDSAGVRLTVDGDPTELSEPMRELAAWLVREATTNVVRHSAATQVTLTLVPDGGGSGGSGGSGGGESVTMSNDGVTRGIDRLSGLAGIRRRAEPLGAQLLAERDGTLFHVTLMTGKE